MNTIYRVVWNAATGKWVVASEFAKGRKKKASTAASITAALALGLSMGGGDVMAATASEEGDTCSSITGFPGYCGQLFGSESVGVLAAFSDTDVRINDRAGVIAQGVDNIAIGNGANVRDTVGSTGVNAGMAIGTTASTAGGWGQIAIGGGATTNDAAAAGAIAIGRNASTSARGVALGDNAVMNAQYSVALGDGAHADRDYTVSVGSSSTKRQIVNMAAGTQATDAVNLSQLSPVVNALGGGASINATTGAVTGPTYTLTNGGKQTTVGGALSALDSALSTKAGTRYFAADGANDGKDDAKATGANAVAVGSGSSASASGSMAMGNAAQARGTDSVVIGNGAQDYSSGKVDGGVVIGAGARLNVSAGAEAQGGIAIGQNAYSYGNNSTAFGAGATVTHSGGTALGAQSYASYSGVAVGNGAIAGSESARNTSAFGVNAQALGNQAVALGTNASVADTVSNAVALGFGSKATRDNTVSVGTGSSNRQITNMAAGTQATDAVNLSQLSPVVNALGGGASINATTGAVTGPTYTLTNGGKQTTVGGALSALDSALSAKAGTRYFAADGANDGTDDAKATGANAVAIGSGAGAEASGAVAMGNSASAKGQGSVVIGDGATDGQVYSQNGPVNGGIAIGSGATLKSGNPNGSDGGSIAIGQGTYAYGNQSVVLGPGASSHNSKGTAIGANALSIGSGTALGNNAQAKGSHSLALGLNANVDDTVSNAVALGADATTTRNSTVSVGNGSSNRQIVNMAAGTQATDAVNLSQLSPVVNALGGGASINATTGAVTGPTYTLTNGGTRTTVGDAFAALDGALTTTNTNVTNLDGRVTVNEGNITTLQQQIGDGTVGLVQQDATTRRITVAAGTDGTVVDFSGTSGARTLSGVADGDLADGSTDAVNGSQLYATNQQVAQNTSDISTINTNVTNLDNRVTVNEGNITTLQQQIGDGTVGLVQQDATTRRITVAAGTDGTVVDFSGTAGERKLAGVADGTVATDSKEAINGGQLHATASSIADAIGGGSTVNPDGSISAPTYTVDGGPVSSIGDAITNIDGRTTDNSTHITEITNQLNSGSIGLVQQLGGAGGPITVGAGTGGSVVDMSGTDGARRITGVANATDDADAVTLAQMKSMGLYDPNTNMPLAAVVYDGTDLSSVTFGGTSGTVLNNVAPGLIAAGSMQAVNGGQLFDMQANFQNQFNLISNQYNLLDNRVTTIEQNNGGGGGGGGVSPGSGEDSTQIGPGADAGGDNSTAIGPGAGAGGDNSTAIGPGADAGGDNSTAIGPGAGAGGDNSTAIGPGSSAGGDNSTAIGPGSNAGGDNSTAIGGGSSASGNNSVAIGNGSVADRDNTVSVGSAGNERQITNVAAGTARTDAANWGQVQDAVNGVQDWANRKFNQVNRRIDGMGAMSAAYGQMAFSAQGINTPNKVGVGVGTMNGQSAIAAGYSRQIKPNLNITFGGAASSRGDVSVGAGLSLGW